MWIQVEVWNEDLNRRSSEQRNDVWRDKCKGRGLTLTGISCISTEETRKIKSVDFLKLKWDWALWFDVDVDVWSWCWVAIEDVRCRKQNQHRSLDPRTSIQINYIKECDQKITRWMRCDWIVLYIPSDIRIGGDLGWCREEEEKEEEDGWMKETGEIWCGFILFESSDLQSWPNLEEWANMDWKSY